MSKSTAAGRVIGSTSTAALIVTLILSRIRRQFAWGSYS
jgi:hypothetical protein